MVLYHFLSDPLAFIKSGASKRERRREGGRKGRGGEKRKIGKDRPLGIP